MKKLSFTAFLTLLAGAAMLMSSCQKETTPARNYLYLSDVLCTFRATENVPVRIQVESSGDWEIGSVVEWVTARKDGDYLVLNVADNITDGERTTTFDITADATSATVTVKQLPDDSMNARFRSLDYLHSACISPNGKYAGGYYSVGDPSTGASMHYIVFVDLETDEKIEFGPYPESMMFLTSVTCMTDQGVMYGVDGNGGMKIFDVNTRDWSNAEAPGYDATQLGVSQITPDGSTWVGFVGMMAEYTPLVSKDGVISELPLTATNFRGQPHESGIIPRGISNDGSVIYGTTWDNKDFGMVYWDRNGAPHFVGEDVRKVTTVKRADGNGDTYDYNIVDGMISWSGQYQISPNGKYIAGTFRTETLASESTGEVSSNYYAAFFNTETETTTVFREFGDASGIAVTDEGIGFVGAPSFNTSAGYVVNVDTGEHLGTMGEWALATYGIYLPSGYVVYVPAGNDIIWGITSRVSIMGTPESAYWYMAPPLD